MTEKKSFGTDLGTPRKMYLYIRNNVSWNLVQAQKLNVEKLNFAIVHGNV